MDLDNEKNNIEPAELIDAKLNARRAYLGYAALAALPDEAVENGLKTIDQLNDQQAKKMQRAFTSVAKVLMEVNPPTVAPEEVEVDPRLPQAGKYYIEDIIGPIEAYDFMVDDVPAIVNTLLQLRGTFRETRLSLDHEKLLDFRLRGLVFSEIASLLESTPKRAASALYRLKDIIQEKGTTEELAAMFRELFGTYDPQDPRPIPQFVMKPHLSKSQVGVKRTRTEEYYQRRKDERKRLSNLRNRGIDPSVFPSDLYAGEKMNERRARLKEEEQG